MYIVFFKQINDTPIDDKPVDLITKRFIKMKLSCRWKKFQIDGVNISV